MARIVEITTPLDADLLLFHRMRGSEHLSRLFEYDLELLSSEPDLDLDRVLGQSITIALTRADKGVRYFNGLCSRIAHAGREGRYFRYHATLRPWLWFLTLRKNCRIFQEKSVPDILKEMFAQHSAIANVEFELTDAYGPWNYCVQYGESDFAFVSRLMEHEGIYYYFRHTDGQHTLVIADAYSAHSPCYPDEIPFIPPQERIRAEREHVSEWSISREVQPGKYALTAFDFEKPRVDLHVRSVIERAHALAEYEVFEYGADYVDRGDGEQYARRRIEEVQAKYERARATTNARAVAPGFLFALGAHPRADQNAEYLIVSAEYELQSAEYEARNAAPAEYSCTLTALNSQQPFRAERITPKPVVPGPQTAIVVGPPGEEIYKDDYGRVKVQFHWDRYGERNENSSCWVRVSEPWAGKGWGSVSTPRIDHEVIVDFLEGDPDQPIITGSVYNAENLPPHGGVTSGLKSNTHKGSGFNEMSMDDTAGQEKIAIHGQYDMNTTVEHDQANAVGVDQTNTVGSNQKEEIGVNRDLTIGANDTVTIGANRETSIGANHTVTVGGSESMSVGGARTASVGGKEDVTIGGSSTLQVGALRTETVAGPHTIVNPRMTITTASQFTVAAGSSFTASSPSVSLLAGSKLLASSGGKMDVKAAGPLNQQSGSAMNIKSGAGLNMQSGAKMNLKAGGPLNSQAGGAMNLKAGGPLTGKAAVIKLNSPTKIKGTTFTVS